MSVIRLGVRARPGASRTRVAGSFGPNRDLVVAVNQPAVDGAANTAVVRALADALGVRAHQLTIAGGQRSRSKVVEVDVPDDEVPRVQARIAELLDS